MENIKEVIDIILHKIDLKGDLDKVSYIRLPQHLQEELIEDLIRGHKGVSATFRIATYRDIPITTTSGEIGIDFKKA